MTGAQLIEDERRRQVERGYTAEKDQERHEPTVASAASIILRGYVGGLVDTFPAPDAVAIAQAVVIRHADDEIRRLQIAGALIAAEIDRIQYRERAANAPRKLSELKGG